MLGYEALRSDAAVLDLSGRTLIRVTGEDRARLLHAMTTNNVAHLSDHSGLYAFFLNAQGRILADSYIWNLHDYLLLDSEPQVRHSLFEHLDKYIIADDVALEDVTERLHVLALEGPNAITEAAKHKLPVPEDDAQVLIFENGFATRASFTGLPAIRFFVPSESVVHLHTLLGPVPTASPEEAEIVRLEIGKPRFGTEISERFLVQETGVLQAVHPNKGCYLGQEIVERVRSRAQIHRHLKRFVLQTSVPPSAGTKLQSADGKDAAEIVSARYSPGLHAVVGFAYVRTEALGQVLSFATADGPVSATFP